MLLSLFFHGSNVRIMFQLVIQVITFWFYRILISIINWDFSGGIIKDLLESVEENLLSVDVRFLGKGDIIKELKFFELTARLYDKDYNSFVNEKPLNLLVKRIEVLNTEVSKSWNINLRDAFRKKRKKKFRHLSKNKHTPPSLPHFWRYSILTNY